MRKLEVFGALELTNQEYLNNCKDCAPALYCTPYINGDKLTFQLPPICCEDEVQGCQTFTEECLGEYSFTSDLSYTLTDGDICFDTTDFSLNDIVAQFDITVASSTNYNLTFEISGNDTVMNFEVYLGSVISPITISGNGLFTITLNSSVQVGTIPFGLRVAGGDDTIRLCLSSATVCVGGVYEITLFQQFPGECITWETWDEFWELEDRRWEDIGCPATDLPITPEQLPSGNWVVNQVLNIPTDLNEGCYKLIVQVCGEVYESGCIFLMAEAPQCDDLLKIQYVNRNSAFGFDYSDPTYVNQFRVKAKLRFPRYEDQSTQYQLSNNTDVITSARVRKLYEFSVEQVPEYIHDQLAIARRHSTFIIDGGNYVAVEGDLSPSWRRSSQYAPVVITVADQTFKGRSGWC